ncbi:NAD(P)/FAD-dependent oxidoreductase [Marisediminicola senii]|uniref:NAD(P)/FAD-dependent oxidoreductase n=1 Tax=Marisediminicola senii TaxID=2711233 RepID=UPI0013EBCB57|nr:FAD-binding oxidoreductase [Marisediminicola senii]
MTRHVIVVGAGIVGVSAAGALARAGVRVTVLERDHGEPRGSTAFAPGFLGLYNESSILTDLARASSAIYAAAKAGYTRTGGLELALSAAGAVEVERRVDAASATGLASGLLRTAELPEPVATLIRTGDIVAAGYFADDGSVDAQILTRSLRIDAVGAGATFLAGQQVMHVERRASQIVVGVASGAVFEADDIVLAGGVWGPSLSHLTGLELPLFPVAHPYVYSPRRPQFRAGPFLRWPERHVYARVHHDRLGIGSYDHPPVAVGQADLSGGAGLQWAGGFTEVIDSAQQLLSERARFVPERRINGVFAMTPDNLPFLGPHLAMDGVWIAQALWATHAAGAATVLVAAMTEDAELPAELTVDRFDGDGAGELSTRALRLYRDIYASGTG